MDELQTWNDLAARVKALPRGAAYKLAAAMGMNASYFYRRINHPKGELSVLQARTARDFFKAAEDDTAPPPFMAPSSSGAIKLPVYGYAAGSDGDLIAMNEGQVLEWYELPHGLLLGPGEFFIIRPIGSSMEPRIFAGDPVVCRRNYPPARDKDVVIEFTDGAGVIKTYQGQRAGRVFAKQWNEEKTLDYDASKVRALHAVAFKL
jgi:SOS-response transcriptional repressor LexA